MINLGARHESHCKVLRILIENHSHSQDMDVKCLDLGFFFGKQVKPTSSRCFLGNANGPLHTIKINSVLLSIESSTDDQDDVMN